jgi:hypothetical protein
MDRAVLITLRNVKPGQFVQSEDSDENMMVRMSHHALKVASDMIHGAFLLTCVDGITGLTATYSDHIMATVTSLRRALEEPAATFTPFRHP